MLSFWQLDRKIHEANSDDPPPWHGSDHQPRGSEALISQSKRGRADKVAKRVGYATSPDEYKGIDPDALYDRPGATCFIYLHKSQIDGQPKIFVGANGDSTHADILRHDHTDRTGYTAAEHVFDGQPPRRPDRTDALPYALLGRIGPNVFYTNGPKIISFWNQEADQYHLWLVPCLQKLMGMGLIANDTMVVTGMDTPSTVGERLGARQPRELTPSTFDTTKLHVAHPDVKRFIRQGLGMPVGSPPNPWDVEWKKLHQEDPNFPYYRRIGDAVEYPGQTYFG
jgi:hypothetical protein